MAALVYFEFGEALLKNHVCDTVYSFNKQLGVTE